MSFNQFMDWSPSTRTDNATFTVTSAHLWAGATEDTPTAYEEPVNGGALQPHEYQSVITGPLELSYDYEAPVGEGYEEPVPYLAVDGGNLHIWNANMGSADHNQFGDYFVPGESTTDDGAPIYYHATEQTGRAPAYEQAAYTYMYSSPREYQMLTQPSGERYYSAADSQNMSLYTNSRHIGNMADAAPSPQDKDNGYEQPTENSSHVNEYDSSCDAELYAAPLATADRYNHLTFVIPSYDGVITSAGTVPETVRVSDVSAYNPLTVQPQSTSATYNY